MKKIVILISDKFNRFLLFFVVVALVLTCSSCATVFLGTRQKVRFDSEPQGATVERDLKLLGVTPFTKRVKRKKTAVYTFSKDHYEEKVVVQRGSFRPASLISTGLIFFDFATGAAWRYEKNKPVTATLELIPPEYYVPPATSFRFNNKGYITHEFRAGFGASWFSVNIPEESVLLQRRYGEDIFPLAPYYSIEYLVNLPLFVKRWESVNFQTGILFANKSINRGGYNNISSIPNLGGSVTSGGTEKSEYLQLPFLISYNKRRWNLSAGYYWAYGWTTSIVRYSELFRNTETGLILGTGWYFKNWYIGGRFYWGVSDVYDGINYRVGVDRRGSGGEWRYEDMEAQSRTFILTTGFRF